VSSANPLDRLRPDLTGSTSVVTGGGQGLGLEIARQLAAAGSHVVVTGRRDAPLQDAVSSIRDSGGDASYVAGDVATASDVDRIFEHVRQCDGDLRVIVNNAAIAGPTKPLAELALQEWEEILATNLTGVFLMCRAGIPMLRAAGGGRIINIGSGTGKRPLPDRSGYAAAKLAVVGLTRTLAHEVGASQITVNTVSPFLIEGPRLDAVIDTMSAMRGITPDDLYEEFVSASPFRHGVRDFDVAGVVLFLASDVAAHMTGQDINVSSGTIMY